MSSSGVKGVAVGTAAGETTCGDVDAMDAEEEDDDFANGYRDAGEGDGEGKAKVEETSITNEGRWRVFLLCCCCL